jgi:hypothetical protein
MAVILSSPADDIAKDDKQSGRKQSAGSLPPGCIHVHAHQRSPWMGDVMKTGANNPICSLFTERLKSPKGYIALITAACKPKPHMIA